MYSFHVDTDDHRRGPTPRHVAGTEIQRDCNFEAHIHHFSFWVVSLVSGLFYRLDHRITFRLSLTGAPLCLVISITSYTKIFRALSYHQAQIQDYAQQQPSQPNALIMARYRKAVYNALWVQLVLVVCYVPKKAVEIVMSLSLKRLSNFIVIRGMANVLVFFNSTLNPFLYCWKISEVRRAVKQTIRQAICYA